MLIFLNIESGVVVPAELHPVLETTEAIQDGALIGARAHSGVTIGHELGMVWLEYLPSLLGSLFQVDDHEAAHQTRGIGLLSIVHGGIVIDLVLRILSIGHKFFELLAEQVYFPKIERPEVGEERLIDQVIVNAEVEGVRSGLGWAAIRDPVEAAGDDLHGRCGTCAVFHILLKQRMISIFTIIY